MELELDVSKFDVGKKYGNNHLCQSMFRLRLHNLFDV